MCIKCLNKAAGWNNGKDCLARPSSGAQGEDNRQWIQTEAFETPFYNKETAFTLKGDQILYQAAQRSESLHPLRFLNPDWVPCAMCSG